MSLIPEQRVYLKPMANAYTFKGPPAARHWPTCKRATVLKQINEQWVRVLIDGEEYNAAAANLSKTNRKSSKSSTRPMNEAGL